MAVYNIEDFRKPDRKPAAQMHLSAYEYRATGTSRVSEPESQLEQLFYIILDERPDANRPFCPGRSFRPRRRH